MKFILFFIALISMTELLAEDQDILFYNNQLNTIEEKCLYHAFNLFSNAIGHGLVENGSRTGLGNKNPVGIQLQASGLYYQLLNILSQADKELIRQIKQDDLGCLPAQLSFQYGSFPETFVQSLSVNEKPFVSKINHALRLLFPDMPVLNLHNLADHFFTDQDQAIASDSLSSYLKVGIEHHLSSLDKAYATHWQHDVVSHIRAVASGYSPLSLRLNINFPQLLTQGAINATLLMPPLHQFLYTDFEDANTWYLQKGFKKTALPVPVKISVANITHISYLDQADLSKKQVIQMDISKLFIVPNELTAHLSFGRLIGKKIETSFPEDALVIYLNMRDEGYVLQVNMHKLGLRFFQEMTDFNTQRLKPQLSINDSQMTFRLHKKATQIEKYQKLLNNGFQCHSVNNIAWDCWRDYDTWDSLPSSLFGVSIESLVNLNIDTIEAAIDDNLSKIIDEMLAALNNPSNILSQRFRNALFQ